MSEVKTVGFKGFDKNLQCNGYQYEVGKEHVHDGPVRLCNTGFHFCEHPLDVFGYYPPASSRFAEVEADGVDGKTDTDTKRVCKTLRIKVEITIKAMIEAAVKFTFDRADWSKKEKQVTGEREGATAPDKLGAASATGYSGAASATGDSGAASATGDRAAASATGDRGAASATGYRAAASATGKHSVACALGVDCTASGAVGCWLVLVEREWIEGEGWTIKNAKTARVDGKKIKANTFYTLKGGKIREVAQ